MTRVKIHVLYEYGIDLRPHASSYIRLIRPLTYPSLRLGLEVTCSAGYEGQDVDVVVVDRLWRPDISIELAKELVKSIRSKGVKFIYSIDDNLLDLPLQRKDWPKEHHLQVYRFFLEEADGVLVTTHALRDRLSSFNQNIFILRNALDEGLLLGGRLPPLASPFNDPRKVIGYMGTTTHDDDLLMVLPALKALWERYPNRIEYQLLGVVARPEIAVALNGIPVQWIGPPEEESEYPLFMFWFTSRVRWDIAIAPLKETPVTRCKSHIKFLDYAAIGTAGIFSRGAPYNSSVRHKETGWLSGNDPNEWIEALDQLLKDDSLRERLARNASYALYQEHILARRANDWLEAMDYLLDSS